MTNILNFIVTNYFWILLITIILIFAMIGYLAEIKGFYNNNNIDENKKESKNDFIDQNEIKEEDISKVSNDTELFQEDDLYNNSNLKIEEVSNKDDSDDNLDVAFEKLDKEFENLLPKKDIVDDDLLNDIDDMVLDKTQKIKIGEIPDLDDVNLPYIKKINKEPENVWEYK